MEQKYQDALVELIREDRRIDQDITSKVKRGMYSAQTKAASRLKREAALVRFVDCMVAEIVARQVKGQELAPS